MTINARVLRWPDADDIAKALSLEALEQNTGDIKTYPCPNPRDGFIIRLEGFHPKSMKGRSILLRLTEKDRDDLLRTLRSEAVRARSSE